MTVRGRKIALYLGVPLGILLVLVVSAALWYFLKMTSEIGKMSAIDSQEVVSGIYAIKDESYINFYVVKSGSGLIAIDSGQNQNNVKNELTKLNLDPLKVAAVFLTHTDSDHVGALGVFPNAKVYLSQEEEQIINGRTPRWLIVSNQLPAHYELLADNQIVEVADCRVRCILTPGHTPGSMSYVVNDRYLFTGDTLSLRNNKVSVFNEFFNMDTDKQKNSIAKLSELPNVRYIFTAHYGYSANYQNSFADWTGK